MLFNHTSSFVQVPDCRRDEVISCRNCVMAGLCIPLSLSRDEIGQLEEIVQRNRVLASDTTIFAQGGRLRSLYAVRAGALKVYRLTKNGDEQVAGFAFPGDIIGLDALAQRRHTTTALTLTQSMLCEMPYDQLDDLSEKIPKLRQGLIGLLSQQITDARNHVGLLNTRSAEQQIAALLLQIACRLGQSKPRLRLDLPMSRRDIANFFGHRVETISRAISRLQRRELIRANRNVIHILNHEELERFADE